MTVNTIHCNSIDVAPDGDLLVSARNMDSIFLISKATGTVLWKMGGATFTRDGAPYIAVHGDPLISFYRQHDARFLPDGTISMFDDHTDEPGAARGVIYSYDVTARIATMVWQYQGTQTSSAMGSFRVLPDGSRVIGWGSAVPGLAFTEVDENAHDLLDFYFTDKRWTYRAIKVPTSAFDIDVLRSAIGSP
jgi:Arylsulfotransferase (ASST)